MEDYYIEDTRILLIHFMEGKPTKDSFYLGSGRDKIGSTGCHFPIDTFIVKDEKNKKLLILERLHYSITKYMKHFNLPLEPLNKANEEVKSSDFYRKYSKTYQFNNKKISFWIEIICNYKDRNYRLVYKEKKFQKIQYLNICTKEMFFGTEHREMDIHEMLKVSQFLEIKGWIDDKNFEMAWGEEKYVFNIDKLIITFFPN